MHKWVSRLLGRIKASFKATDQAGPSSMTLRTFLSATRVAEIEDDVVLHITDPGCVPEEKCEHLLPNVQLMFVEDHKLGIVYGQGGGHAFVLSQALKQAVLRYVGDLAGRMAAHGDSVTNLEKDVLFSHLDFNRLCAFVREAGYNIEEIYWLLYHRLPHWPDIVREECWPKHLLNHDDADSR
jgi:hypothetical protein